MSIDKQSLGNKLKRCRENLLLDISEISNNIGITIDRIQAIEQGAIEPTGDEILIFSDFYKQDYRYFISNEKLSASEQIEVLYRKFGDNFSHEDRLAIQDFIFLCESEEDIHHYLNYEKQEFHLPKHEKVYKSQGVEAAKKLRSFLGYNTNKLYSDLYSEFRKIGIHIFRRKLKNSNISGLFLKHPTAGKCILVNYVDDIYRQNFTLAHEICHSLLDNDFDFNVSFESENNFREIRANAFASEFLIPESILNPLKSITWTNEIIFKIANQLKVNILPLLISLKSKNYINQTEFDNFKDLKISKADKEDYELKGLSPKIYSSKKVLLEKGLTSFYIRKCHEAYNEGYISSGKLAEILLVEESELSTILDLFNLKLDNGN